MLCYVWSQQKGQKKSLSGIVAPLQHHWVSHSFGSKCHLKPVKIPSLALCIMKMMMVDDRGSSLVLCGVSGNSLVQSPTQEYDPKRGVIITKPKQKSSEKASHHQGDTSVAFFCIPAKATPATESSKSKADNFLTKRKGALLLYFLFPWTLSQAGKQHPKVRYQSKMGELHLSLTH